MTSTLSDVRVTLRKILMPSLLIGAFGAAGLMLFGLTLPVAIQEYKKDRHTLSIKGLFEEVVRADRANMRFTISVAGNQLEGLYAEATKHTQQLRSYLVQSGLAEAHISVGVPELTDNKARQATSGATRLSFSGPRAEGDQAPAQGAIDTSPARYFLNINVSVKSPNVDLCHKLLQDAGALLNLGIPIVGSDVEYEYSKFGENRIAMLEKAFQNAKEAAQSFAAVSGAKLGGIQHADQGHFSIDDTQRYGSSLDKKIRVVVYVNYIIRPDKEQKHNEPHCRDR